MRAKFPSSFTPEFHTIFQKGRDMKMFPKFSFWGSRKQPKRTSQPAQLAPCALKSLESGACWPS